MTNETAILDDVLGASSLMDLAGSEGKKAERVYLMYARKVHPDMFQDETTKLKAEKAFQHLSSLKTLGEGKLNAVSPAGNRAAPPKKDVFKGSVNDYEPKIIFQKNDVFTKYSSTFNNGHDEADLFVLGSAANADLAAAHITAMEKLANVSGEHRFTYPVMIEHTAPDATPMFIANHVAPGYRSMADIRTVYPMGINGKDVAWIFRAMLSAVHNAHEMGFVNGAPTLDSFMIHEQRQAVILSDWQHSVEFGQPLTAIPSSYKNVYPKYAVDGEQVDDRLDIYLIATMATRLLSMGEPKPLYDFFRSCKRDDVPRIPDLLMEFNDVMQFVYGKKPKKPFSFKQW